MHICVIDSASAGPIGWGMELLLLSVEVSLCFKLEFIINKHRTDADSLVLELKDRVSERMDQREWESNRTGCVSDILSEPLQGDQPVC